MDRYTVKLTKAQYAALTRLTSGDPELQTDRTKSLRTALDRAQFQSRTDRYFVQFTIQDVRSARYVLDVHALDHGTQCVNRFSREYGYLLGSGPVSA